MFVCSLFADCLDFTLPIGMLASFASFSFPSSNNSYAAYPLHKDSCIASLNLANKKSANGSFAYVSMFGYSWFITYMSLICLKVGNALTINNIRKSHAIKLTMNNKNVAARFLSSALKKKKKTKNNLLSMRRRRMHIYICKLKEMYVIMTGNADWRAYQREMFGFHKRFISICKPWGWVG